MTTGWKLDRKQREALLVLYPPRYANVVADHVTLHPNLPGDPPSAVSSACIVGHADDAEGVEALVVAIDGGTLRSDGGTWHITWSLADGRRARESNDVIREIGFIPLDGDDLFLIPASW